MAKARRIGLGPVCARMLHPSSSYVFLRDRLGYKSRTRDSQRHLNETMAWLARAQDRAHGTAGVSAGYSLVYGWLPPYPETTGYIIPTFFEYAGLTGDEELVGRGIRMADWEIEVQLPTGAVQAGLYDKTSRAGQPAVFNTGQVILGWCRAFDETKDTRYLEAAVRGANWLVSVQKSDGAWWHQSQETETDVHAYDVRTAWSLLELHKFVPEAKYHLAARANVSWTLSQQQENGWFCNNAFFTSKQKWNMPLTHTIAYVLEGLLGAWEHLKDSRCLEAVMKTGERLLRIYELRKRLPGEFDSNWKSTATYECLPGSAQLAGVWLRIYNISGDTRYLSAALKLNDSVKSTQFLHSLRPGIRGGVKGSHPIYGKYSPLTFVNWGAMFLADSLMLEHKVMSDFEQAVRKGERIGPNLRHDDQAGQSYGKIGSGVPPRSAC